MFLLCFSYDNLAEAEQFALSLANIKRLVPRLKSLRCVQLYTFPFLQQIGPWRFITLVLCNQHGYGAMTQASGLWSYYYNIGVFRWPFQNV